MQRQKTGLHKQLKEVICKICDRYINMECNGSSDHVVICVTALRNYHINAEGAKIKAAKEAEVKEKMAMEKATNVTPESPKDICPAEQHDDPMHCGSCGKPECGAGSD